MSRAPEMLILAALAVLVIARPGFAPEGPPIAVVNDPPSPEDGGTDAPVATFTPDDSARLPGIDVSHWQGEVDWQQVAASGVAFAFAKATDGVTGIDHSHDANIAGATAAGIPIGSFHYYEPNDTPEDQAAHFLSKAHIAPGSMPPVVDVEKAAASTSAAEFSRDVAGFMAQVEQATGCAPLLYASPSFFNEHFDDQLAGVPYWLAEYASAPRPPSGDSTWVIWQHSQTGKVDGISKSVDLDWFAGDAAALETFLCK